MFADWQQLIAVACVAVATAVLARRAWGWWKASSAGDCGAGGGCGSCPSAQATPDRAGAVKPLVTLDLGVPRRPTGPS